MLEGGLGEQHIEFEVGSLQPPGVFLLLALRTKSPSVSFCRFIEGFGKSSGSHHDQMCVDGG